jgi:hypothetical protein
METMWQPAMKSAISEVLETMFFESVNFGSQNPLVRNCCCDSNIRLSNATESREITFRVTEHFARLLAANFLASDEDEVTPEEIADVMRELANMVGGNYLARLKDEQWWLGIPTFSLVERKDEETTLGLPLSYMGECVGSIFMRPVGER